MGVSAAILFLLFLGQRLGASKIGFLFSPILILWFIVNSAVGVYNIAKYMPDVFKVSSSAC